MLYAECGCWIISIVRKPEENKARINFYRRIASGPHIFQDFKLKAQLHKIS